MSGVSSIEEDVSVGDVRRAGCGVLDSPSSPAAGGADWDYVCLCAAPLRTPTWHVHRVHHLSDLPPVFGPDPAKNIFKIKSSKLVYVFVDLLYLVYRHVLSGPHAIRTYCLLSQVIYWLGKDKVKKSHVCMHLHLLV